MAGASNVGKKIGESFGVFEKFGSKAMFAFDVYSAVDDYKTYREQGGSKIGSAARAAGNFALYNALGGWALPYMILPAIPGAAVSAYEGIGKMTREMDRQSRQTPFASSHFQDFNQAVTMRQAGMKMAQASKYNLQQTLMGNEAAYLKR